MMQPPAPLQRRCNSFPMPISSSLSHFPELALHQDKSMFPSPTLPVPSVSTEDVQSGLRCRYDYGKHWQNSGLHCKNKRSICNCSSNSRRCFGVGCSFSRSRSGVVVATPLIFVGGYRWFYCVQDCTEAQSKTSICRIIQAMETVFKHLLRNNPNVHKER